MKKRKLVLLLCAMAALVVLSGLAWQAAGRYSAIHAELRTPHMEQVEETLASGTLTRQELLAEPVKKDGVVLHRAAYYPEAQTLVCFLQNADPHRDIYLDRLPDLNYTQTADAYGISTLVFEGVPPEALGGGLVVDRTNWQFESSHPVVFPLTV